VGTGGEVLGRKARTSPGADDWMRRLDGPWCRVGCPEEAGLKPAGTQERGADGGIGGIERLGVGGQGWLEEGVS
jgi:hypothetical protein